MGTTNLSDLSVDSLSTGDVTATGDATLGTDEANTLTINSILTIPLAALPEYADQATAAAALDAGRIFRVTTTGALAVVLS